MYILFMSGESPNFKRHTTTNLSSEQGELVIRANSMIDGKRWHQYYAGLWEEDASMALV